MHCYVDPWINPLVVHTKIYLLNLPAAEMHQRHKKCRDW
jgi:hypothetical protein